MSPMAKVYLATLAGAAMCAAAFALLKLVFQWPWNIGTAAVLVTFGVPFRFFAARFRKSRKELIDAISPSFPEYSKYWPNYFGIVYERYTKLSTFDFKSLFDRYVRAVFLNEFFTGAGIVIVILALGSFVRTI